MGCGASVQNPQDDSKGLPIKEIQNWGHDNNKEGNITVAEAMPHQAKQDALSALISLGYKLNDAKRALESITDVELSSEAMIRQGLKNLTKSR